MRLFGSNSTEYPVNFAKRLAGCGDLKAQKVGNFLTKIVKSEIGNYHGFEIVFEPPIALQKDILYDFKVDITGPPSWYGQGGQFTVEHSGVTFSFFSFWEQTDVGVGQFSEFVFTVD